MIPSNNGNNEIIYFRTVAHSAVLIYKGPSIYSKVTKHQIRHLHQIKSNH